MKGFQLPLFMGLGLLPFPAKLTHYIGEPICFEEGPDLAEDKDVCLRLRERVVQAMEELKIKGLRERGEDVFDLWPVKSPGVNDNEPIQSDGINIRS